MGGHALWITVGLLVGGCFSPHLTNGAFRCDPHDDPPCPAGFYCYSGRCVHDGADVGPSTPHDFAGAAGDLAGEADLSIAPGSDLAHGPADASVPPDLQPPLDLQTPRDLTPPPDLATGQCGHAGAPCTTIQDCCSQYCRTDGICIGG